MPARTAGVATSPRASTSGPPISEKTIAFISASWTGPTVHARASRRKREIVVARGTPSLQRRHHVVREQPETPRFQIVWNEPAGVQLGDDAVEPELVSELRQPIDH